MILTASPLGFWPEVYATLDDLLFWMNMYVLNTDTMITGQKSVSVTCERKKEKYRFHAI